MSVPPEATLVRRTEFRATHAYGRDAWSEERNAQVFGEQRHPHEHLWRIEVHVRGPLDPETGWVVDLGALDALLEREIRGRLEGRAIQRVLAGELPSSQPSTEALALWLLDRLRDRLPPPARLVRVRVAEDETLWSEASDDGR